MVFHGPSKGCQACRKRRVKCDEKRPFCGNCVRRKQQVLCIYRRFTEDAKKDRKSLNIDDEPSPPAPWNTPPSEDGSTNAVTRSTPDDHDDFGRVYAAVLDLFQPKLDRDHESLCFFYGNYIYVPREKRSNILIDVVMPLYKQASVTSPLKFATAAVASNIADVWRRIGPDSVHSRRLYAEATTALREGLQHPDGVATDDLFASIFMLDFYESLNKRYTRSNTISIHQRAAMAIVQQHGRQHLKTNSSRRLFTALRARYIWTLLQSQPDVELDHELLKKDYKDPRPSSRLELVMADLAILLADSRIYFQVDPTSVGTMPNTPTSSTKADSTIQDLLLRSLDVDDRLDQWERDLPRSFRPVRIKKQDKIHQSIRAVGVYNGLCDVYSTLYVCTAYNGWRLLKIMSLRVRRFFMFRLREECARSQEHESAETDEIDTQLQTIADDICASIPFYLGSRTGFTMPNEPQNYPPIPFHLRSMVDFVDRDGQPTIMTEEDHARNATASGGWFVLTPVALLLQFAEQPPSDRNWAPVPQLEPIRLREGQLEWVRGQLKRIAHLHRIRWPLPKTSDSGLPSSSFSMPPGLGHMLRTSP